MIIRWSAALALLAALGGADAFAAVRPATAAAATASRSALRMGPPTDPSAPVTETFGEGSRKYRRTVYTHAEWVKHRSPDRFWNNLGTLFNSGIYKQVWAEVALTTG